MNENTTYVPTIRDAFGAIRELAKDLDALLKRVAYLELKAAGIEPEELEADPEPA